MMAASQLAPTKRELVLLAGLFVALLFLVPSSYMSDTALPVTSINMHNDAQHEADKGVSSTITYPEPRLTWADTMPETEMLHHSPGEYLVQL